MYRATDQSSPARILALNLGPLSHIVFMLPALKALREHFPAARLTVAATPRGCDVLRLAPLAVDFLTIDRWQPGQIYLPWVAYPMLRFVRELARHRYDTVVDFHASRETSFLLWWLMNRWRWPLGRRVALWNVVAAPLSRDPNPYKHIVDRYLDQIKSLGVAAADRVPRLTTNPASDARIQEILHARRVERGEMLIGLDPTAETGPPFWPLESYGEVARQLVHAFQVRPLVVRVRKEGPAGQLARAGFPAETVVVTLARLTDVASLLARLTLMISEDSALGHLAAALDVPTIMIGCPITRKPLGEHHQFVNSFGSPVVTVSDIFAMAAEALRRTRTISLFER